MEGEGFSQACANCGVRLEHGVWHPCETERDEAGALDIFTFCSEECRDDWTG
jgi:hypothetical protein